MYKRWISLLLLLGGLLSVSIAQGETSKIQARIYWESKDAWFQLSHSHLDIVWRADNYLEIITNATQLDSLQAAGYKTEVIHSDVSAFYRSRLPDKAMGAYKTLDEIYAHVDSLAAVHPDIITTRTSIGQTIEGRDIWAVKISDNPDIDEDEPEVLYTACIHAREVITPEILLNYMDYLSQNYASDPEVSNLVDNREMWFVLVVNPDGYYHNEIISPNGGGMWRKNRRDNGDGSYGVDLNRNSGYYWGYDDDGSSPYPSDETYRGTGPFSEPETQALRDFAIARNFVMTLYFHSYSNLILWPWGYEEIYCPDEEVFSQMGDTISAMNGYTPGPSWILYLTNGTSDDWHYGEQTLKDKSFAITIEAGGDDDGFWPPANRIDDLVSENLEPCLFWARIADGVYQLLPPEAPVLSIQDTVNPAGYEVSWSQYDTLNPAISFELVELQDEQVGVDSAESFDNWVNQEFAVTSGRYYSTPTSFYSGEQNSSIRYIQSIEPYTVQPGDTLRFETYYDIESGWDYAYVEVSVDGITFQPIPGNITTTSDPYGNNHGNGITGASIGGWTDGLFDLGDYVGQDIYIRFSYHTDAYVLEEGIYIDDISPVINFGSQTVYGPISETSYSFADKPAGTYFYKVRARDHEDQWSVYSNRVETQAVSSYVCGDANGDGNVNSGDAVKIINYVFKGGDAPDPLEAGDANGDGAVNAGDAVYIINFVFRDGSEAVCP